jgi:hypothetical protein
MNILHTLVAKERILNLRILNLSSNLNYAMRMISFALLFVVTSCTGKPSESFIPQEYEFPDEQIEGGKTFVYQNTVTKEESFTDLRLIGRGAAKFRSLKNYNTQGVLDSTITTNGRTTESFNFILSADGKAVRGQNTQDTIVDDGSKLGKRLTTWQYITPNIMNTSVFSGKFTNDTTVQWKDKKLPCIVIESKGDIKLQAVNGGGESRTMTVFSKIYYAKGLGLFQQTVDFTDHAGKHNSNTWRLINIRNPR